MAFFGSFPEQSGANLAVPWLTEVPPGLITLLHKVQFPQWCLLAVDDGHKHPETSVSSAVSWLTSSWLTVSSSSSLSPMQSQVESYYSESGVPGLSSARKPAWQFAGPAVVPVQTGGLPIMSCHALWGTWLAWLGEIFALEMKVMPSDGWYIVWFSHG